MKIVVLTLLLLIQIASGQIFQTIVYTKANTTAVTNNLTTYTDYRTCECDIYANSCEYACCCDPDCSEASVLIWQNSGICYETQIFAQTLLYCDNSSQLADLTDSIQQKYVKITDLRGLDCIYVQRFPPKIGYFYNEQAEITGAVASVLSQSTQNFYTYAANRTANLTAYINPTNYSQGMNILTTISVTALSYTTTQARFPLPEQSLSGYCDDTVSAQYLVNVPPRACSRITTLTSACDATSFLGEATWSSTISVFASPNSSTTLLTVTPSTTVASPILTSGTPCTCANAIVGASYQFVITGTTITSVSVTLNTTTLTASSCSASVLINQVFSASFVNSTSAIPKSGNPGYITGYPLLVGTLSSANPLAIALSTSSFYLQGIATDGSCILTSSTTTQLFDPSYIPAFGQNLYATCQQTFSSSASLSSFCSSTVLSTLTLYNNFNSSVYIGRYGSSNINYISDWVTLNTSAESNQTITYNSATLTCSIPTRMDVVIVYSGAGYTSNLQNYIIDVTITTSSDTYITMASSTAAHTATFGLNITFVEATIQELDPSVAAVPTDTSYLGKVFSPLLNP